MKLHFPTRFGIALAGLCGLVLALGVFAFRAQADAWDKKTVLTVQQPIQIQDTYLEPGTYVLKLLDSNSDRHIVQIFNSDQTHLINTVLAINNYRLEPTGHSQFTFYETPPETAAAMHAWFYPGDNFGQEFRYPKQLRKLTTVALATPAPTPTPAAEVTKEVTKQETESVTPPAPAPQAVTETAKREEQVEIAQNTPPPAPQAAATTEPPAPEEPRTLPQTATPYPLVGLLGLISLAGYVFLRVRSAS